MRALSTLEPADNLKPDPESRRLQWHTPRGSTRGSSRDASANTTKSNRQHLHNDSLHYAHHGSLQNSHQAPSTPRSPRPDGAEADSGPPRATDLTHGASHKPHKPHRRTDPVVGSSVPGHLPSIGLLSHCATPRTRVTDWPKRDARTRLLTVQKAYDAHKSQGLFPWQRPAPWNHDAQRPNGPDASGDMRAEGADGHPEVSPGGHAGRRGLRASWRTPRRQVDPALVVRADGLIEPLFARGEVSG